MNLKKLRLTWKNSLEFLYDYLIAIPLWKFSTTARFKGYPRWVYWTVVLGIFIFLVALEETILKKFTSTTLSISITSVLKILQN